MPWDSDTNDWSTGFGNGYGRIRTRIPYMIVGGKGSALVHVLRLIDVQVLHAPTADTVLGLQAPLLGNQDIDLNSQFRDVLTDTGASISLTINQPNYYLFDSPKWNHLPDTFRFASPQINDKIILLLTLEVGARIRNGQGGEDDLGG